ncbi:hypothetical protein FGO68_gene11444 [Halteria grandinella]|uniref:Uncharacterized protein n=1 Tax=Halteria grandinella TaxID=5974 RepID=A0A8J8NSH5_HALGN|nr:hypothetical protein FGO68_gene11444 [Halteria grandinella]
MNQMALSSVRPGVLIEYSTLDIENIVFSSFVIVCAIFDLSVLLYFLFTTAKFLQSQNKTSNTSQKNQINGIDASSLSTWICLGTAVIIRDFVFIVYWPLDLMRVIDHDQYSSPVLQWYRDNFKAIWDSATVIRCVSKLLRNTAFLINISRWTLIVINYSESQSYRKDRKHLESISGNALQGEQSVSVDSIDYKKRQLLSYETKRLITQVLLIMAISSLVLLYLVPAFIIEGLSTNDKLYIWEFSEAYILNPLILLFYLAIYLVLRQHHKEFLSMYKFTPQEKRSVSLANREIGKFFLYIGQRLFTETIGGAIFTVLLARDKGLQDMNLRRAYYYFSVFELLSETLLIAGICQSITRTVKTAKEHESHDLADTVQKHDHDRTLSETETIDEEKSLVQFDEDETSHVSGNFKSNNHFSKRIFQQQLKDDSISEQLSGQVNKSYLSKHFSQRNEWQFILGTDGGGGAESQRSVNPNLMSRMLQNRNDSLASGGEFLTDDSIRRIR